MVRLALVNVRLTVVSCDGLAYVNIVTKQLLQTIKNKDTRFSLMDYPGFVFGNVCYL